MVRKTSSNFSTKKPEPSKKKNVGQGTHEYLRVVKKR